MKKLTQTILITSLLFISSFSFSQIPDMEKSYGWYPTQDQNDKLTKEQNLAAESAANIGTSKDKATEKKNAEEAGKHFANARVTLEEIKKNRPENEKPSASFNSIAIYKFHEAANDHHRALMAELSKEKYDQRLVRRHANDFKNDMGYAETEHKKLIKEINR